MKEQNNWVTNLENQLNLALKEVFFETNSHIKRRHSEESQYGEYGYKKKR
ncbi:MAG: hypothetical protein QM752_01725 [Gammaproteobacteria bacterium]